jgi:hypothetical protein
MLTIYKDDKKIKNVDDIQKIYEEKFIVKAKSNKEIDILEVIKEIKDKINVDQSHKSFLEFIINLFNHLIIKEGKDLSISLSIDEIDPKELIKMNLIKEEYKEEFSDEISKSLIIADLNLSKLKKDKIKLEMDDIFFIINPNWRNNIIPDYKKYPSLLYFLFKNPTCEKELIEYLSRTDSIKDKEQDKFPTFLLILRIFSNMDCISIQINEKTFIGSIIKENIINEFKCKTDEEFENSPDINWLGLVINNNDVNEYFSPKMNYIYQYLENLSNFTYRPDEENINNYKEVFKKLIQSLLKIIFKGKLDQLFKEEISKIDENNEEIKDIIFITNLPLIFENKLNKENHDLEINLYQQFKVIIKNINDIYNNNKDIYKQLIDAINKDTKEEKIKRIESEYNIEKNNKETEYNEIEGNKNAYNENITKLDECGDFNEYNKTIKELIKGRDILIKKK